MTNPDTNTQIQNPQQWRAWAECYHPDVLMARRHGISTLVMSPFGLQLFENQSDELWFDDRALYLYAHNGTPLCLALPVQFVRREVEVGAGVFCFSG